MDVPKGFAKDAKDLAELLKKINKDMENKNSEYIIKVNCPYFFGPNSSNSRPSHVLVKVRGTEVLGIKCDFYKKNNCPGCWNQEEDGYGCYLLEDWQGKD